MVQLLQEDDWRWASVWATASMPIAVDGTLVDTTIRQTLRITADSTRLRLRLSNEYGQSPLVIDAITVAVPKPHDKKTAGSPLIHESTLHTVTFSDEPRLVIPPRSTALSDEIPLHILGGSDLAVSIHLPEGVATASVTGHFDSKSETWMLTGDHTRQADISAGSSSTQNYVVTGIDGWAASTNVGVVCFGDSITDRGDSYLPYNEYFGWIDHLAARLNRWKTEPHFSLLNLGISGDMVSAGGIARFDRDIQQLGVKYVIIHIGVNDLGMNPNSDEAQEQLYHRLVFAYKQLIAKAHARGLVVIGTTIMPFLCPPGWPTPWIFTSELRNKWREKINAWLLDYKGFDHVVDLSKAVSDSENPQRIRTEYQLTDYLHPSTEGYAAMAQAFDVGIFRQKVDGELGS